MGGQFSKKTGESLSAIQTPGNLLYTAELSSYESACRLDPDLQTFDIALHARTNRVINSLAVGVELRSLSFDSLREVTGSFVEMNQEVAKILLECKKDIWKNPELSDLVEEYFDKSLQMFDFCAALEKCLSRARDSQLIIQLALQHFEAEGNGSTGDEKKYSRTLEELKNFKAAGDPFTEEFFQIFESIYKQQISMLEKLQLHKSNINEKLKSVKTWRKVSSIIFASAIVAVFIFTVVAAAVAAPTVVTALAATAASVPLESMGKWFNSLWTNYEVALKEQKEMVSSMWAGTFIAIKDMDSIRALVDQLEIEIESLLRNVDFSLGDEEAVRVGIGEIKKKMGVFTTSLKDLGDHINSCIRDIRMARTLVLQKMINPPNRVKEDA